MTTLDTLLPHPTVPLLQTRGSGFPPQPVDAVWLSQSETAIAISERWAIIPGQAVRVLGPVDADTNQPQWQAVAKVGAVQPYLDGQRVTLAPCWGTLAANAAWLEGLVDPIDFLLNQHPAARPLQLLGQPVGVAQPLQGQGWQLTGTCVAGKQAILKELLAEFSTGWVLDGSGWYDSTFSFVGGNTAPLPITPQQRFELAKHLCDTLDGFLSPTDITALMQASTLDNATLCDTIQALCEALPSLPIVPYEAIEGLYWNMAALPSCWQPALAQLWAQAIGSHQPSVVVVIWPEPLGLNVNNLFSQWQEQGTCVVCLPQEKPSHTVAPWHCVDAAIAWPLAAMESDALGSITSTQSVPYDVVFTVQGPATWQLPVSWTLPGEVLANGPVEWQAYGVQQPVKKPAPQYSSHVEETLPSPTPWVDSYDVSEPRPWISEQVEDLPAAVPALEETSPLPEGLMADLGPLPDLSDLSSLTSLVGLDANPTFSDDEEGIPWVQEQPVTETMRPTEAPLPAPLFHQEPLPVSESAFTEGQRVVHPKYGYGIVGQIIPTGQRHTLQVAFETAGIRLLDAVQSGLQSA